MEQGAAFGTRFAGSSANAARLGVQYRAAQHEIGAEVTEFGTIDHRANVLRLGVRASTVQAMLNGLQANVMTVGAVVNAVVHRLIQAGVNGIRFVVGHVFCLSELEEGARLEG